MFLHLYFILIPLKALRMKMKSDYKLWLNNHKFDICDGQAWLGLLNGVEKEVNDTPKLNVSGDILNKALVPLSDIEGRPNVFLRKLKQAGVIKSVVIDETTKKLKINLNQNFHGTIAFCGDLTSYKFNDNNQLFVECYGNEMTIELFEELLEQIKNHNRDNNNIDKQIQFVAVPGNHEFYGFQGVCDNYTVLGLTDDALKIDCGSALLVKLRGLKVIADIQKYFLEQVNVRGKLNDIQDDDYDDEYNKCENIEEKIRALEKESNNISEHINQIIEARNSIDRLCLPQEMFNELKAVDKNNFADFKFSTLKELNWTNSALLPKIVFCHNGRKFRVLHSFALFTPEKYLKRDNDKTSVNYGQNIAEHASDINQNTQQGIFKMLFSDIYTT